MTRKTKKVLVTKEFRDKAIESNKATDEIASFVLALLGKLDEILSDGQKQQLDEFISRLDL